MTPQLVFHDGAPFFGCTVRCYWTPMCSLWLCNALSYSAENIPWIKDSVFLCSLQSTMLSLPHSLFPFLSLSICSASGLAWPRLPSPWSPFLQVRCCPSFPRFLPLLFSFCFSPLTYSELPFRYHLPLSCFPIVVHLLLSRSVFHYLCRSINVFPSRSLH